VDKDFGTISTRAKSTGRFTGRKKVKGFGDRTAILRVSSPVKYSGRLIGRTKSIKVKGSKTARAHKRIIKRTL